MFYIDNIGIVIGYQLIIALRFRNGNGKSPTSRSCSHRGLSFIGWLVVSTPLKNMKVSWDHYSQYM